MEQTYREMAKLLLLIGYITRIVKVYCKMTPRGPFSFWSDFSSSNTTTREGSEREQALAPRKKGKWGRTALWLERAFHIEVPLYFFIQGSVTNMYKKIQQPVFFNKSINERFMLNEMTRQNASKFAISYIYENPKLLFPFFISCYFICRHRPGHSLWGKIK